MKSHRRAKAAAALFSALGALAALSAQPAPADPATPATETIVLDPLVVSAAKTGEPLSELPVAATVMLPARLEALRIQDITRIEQTAPNVSLASTGQAGARFFSIRGLESNSFIVNRTATYIDGIPFRELDTELFPDVASIEILRGPQGTLYGTNTEAGVVIINTRRPGLEPSGRLETEASSYRHGEAVGFNTYFTTPLPISGLYASLSLGAKEADAFVPNPYALGGDTGEVNQRYGRLRLLYAPGGATELQFLAYGTRLRAPGVYEQDYLPTNRALYNQLYAGFNGGRPLRRGEQAGEQDKNLEQDDYGFAVQGETAPTPETRLAFITSFRREKEDEFGIDFDLTALPTGTGGSDKTVDSRNHELRYSSAPGSDLGWVVGLNHYAEEKNQQLKALAAGSPAITRLAPGSTKGRDYAAFGQVKLPFADSRVHLTLGLRYEIAERERRQQEFTLFVPGFGSLTQPGKALDDSFDALLPRFALDYKLGQHGLAYASVTRGWLPGGFNLEAVAPGISQDLSAYDPEYTWTYELGVKNEWLDGRLRAAAAIFYNDVSGWQDYNVLVDINGVAQSTNIISNATSLESYGAEFEIAYDFAPNWTADASLGITRATYGDYIFGPAQDFSGNTAKLVPAWDASLGIGYAPARGWFFRTDLSLKGPLYLNPENTYRQSLTPLLDLSVGYAFDHWRLTAFVENATDEYYFNGQVYTNFAFGNDGLFYGPVGAPRTVGLSARLSF